MILYKNFKKQKSDFISAKKLWEATLELSVYKAKKIGWINLCASDFDGNPMLAYYNHEQKKQIRIIQINEKDAVKWDFSFWVDKFGDAKSFHGNELVLSALLTEENLKKASKLITQWLNDDVISEEQLKI